jgi:outer membrane lipase/esterase
MRIPFGIPVLSLSLALTSFTISPAAALAATPTYSGLVVFGDSYCDVGNALLAGGIPFGYYTYNGQFSNGPIWVVHVAGYLGLPLSPALAGGTDYAVAGAEATAPVSTKYGAIPSVPEQVAAYLLQHGGKADPNALFILEGGGNDILNSTSGTPEELGYKIAASIAASELLLRQAGARHFLIPNLFNVGLLPAAQANAAFATAASNATNTALNQLLSLEMLLEGVHILRIDVFGLFNAVFTDPTHFGFTNLTTPCYTEGTVPCIDRDHTLFWDPEHVSEFAHGYFAVTTETVLNMQHP